MALNLSSLFNNYNQRISSVYLRNVQKVKQSQTDVQKIFPSLREILKRSLINCLNILIWQEDEKKTFPQ